MIYRVGDEFLVDPNDLQEGKSPRKMFVGAVTIEQGVVTELWLRGIGDNSEIGYSIESLKPA